MSREELYPTSERVIMDQYENMVISDEQRSHIESMFLEEVGRFSPNQDIGLSQLKDDQKSSTESTCRDSALMLEVKKYEAKHMDSNDDDFTIIYGIDMDRYSKFETDERDQDYKNLDNLRVTLEYAQLYERNLSLYLENERANYHAQSHVVTGLKELLSEYDFAISRKRMRIQELEDERKRKKGDEYQRKYQYLQERWNEGIKAIVEMGIEAKRREIGFE